LYLLRWEQIWYVYQDYHITSIYVFFCENVEVVVRSFKLRIPPI